MTPRHPPQFDHCTKCTICTEYCPVSAATPDFPGPKQAGPDGERLRLKDPHAFDGALKLCTNCKRCEVACPSGVDISDIIQRARKDQGPRNRSLRDALLSHTDWIGALAASPLAPLVNACTSLTPVKKLLDVVLGIPSERRFPHYATTSFRRWFMSHAAVDQQRYGEKVVFFHGCFANYNNPTLGAEVIKVLNALGVGVALLSKERCCGVPLIANGYFGQARRNALINAASVAAATAKGLPVVAASSTCVMTLRDEYPQVLDVDNTSWRSNVLLLTRYLSALFDRIPAPGVTLRPVPVKVAYHTSCHMEKLGWACYSIGLLRRIPGLQLQLLPSQCCGIAGTYGFKRENYATAQEIGSHLLAEIDQLDVDMIVTECETCSMQIEMATSKRCVHPVTLLAQALA